MNVPSTDSAVPTGWNADHHAPTHFVVRCTRCGRLDIFGSRSDAHNRADDHGLRCRATGVTPVSKPGRTPAAVDVEADPSSLAVSDGGLNPLDADLSGEDVVVRYESVSKRAGEQQATGEVTAMVPAGDGADFDHLGFVFRTEDGNRRQVNVLAAEVLCDHNVGGWRCIGDLRGFAPATTADNPPVMTDGGPGSDA